MDFRKFGDTWVVRLDKGQEVVACLQALCRQESIHLGAISGIGAIDSVTMRFFDTSTKNYVDKTIDRRMEITSLVGNISRMDGQVYLHLHVNVAGDDYQSFGGHLLAARVSATAEFFIQQAPGTVERTFSEEIGLNLLDFNKNNN